MEAPEKLYFDTSDINGILSIYSDKEPNDTIEYIRTDAFIEKACDAYCKVCKMPNCRSSECKWISDFKGYLETV